MKSVRKAIPVSRAAGASFPRLQFDMAMKKCCKVKTGGKPTASKLKLSNDPKLMVVVSDESQTDVTKSESNVEPKNDAQKTVYFPKRPVPLQKPYSNYCHSVD